MRKGREGEMLYLQSCIIYNSNDVKRSERVWDLEALNVTQMLLRPCVKQ